MDPVGRKPSVNRERRRALGRLLGTVGLVALLSAPACFGPRGSAPAPPDLGSPAANDNESRGAAAVFAPVTPLPEESVEPTPADNVLGRPGVPAPAETANAPQEIPAPAPPAPSAGVVPAPAPETAPRAASPPAAGPTGRERAASAEKEATSAEAPPRGRAPVAPAAPPNAPKASEPAAVRGPEREPRETAQERPAWSASHEELAYRVDFLGVTMGYARFVYRGKVAVGGRPAYHLSVRAWTSGVLSYIYPINETINYYLDVDTLAPIRQEFTERARDKDDVAVYNQETGKITYRYRESGEIRKQVQTVPGIYDPVSAVYYFRWKDLGGEERPRNVYAGRKIWQISARVLGTERLQTPQGEVDTLVVQPVIRREGKLENKGELRMWVSDDERRVPVRLFGKFHKIIDWTLVGELLPVQKRG